MGRVSQIENGELARIDVLDRYVHALGGYLQIVANFGDEQIKVGYVELIADGSGV